MADVRHSRTSAFWATYLYVEVGKSKNSNISDMPNRKADFDALYVSIYKPLCAYATRYVSVDEAEEIVQDTMLWLWDNWDTIAPEKSVKALLFRIVHNKALNCIKHNAVLSRVHQQIEQRLSEQFESPNFYMDKELQQLLENAIKQLPENLREVFILSRVEQLSYKEIAERLDITVKAVDNRLARTMKILRQELKDYLTIILLASALVNIVP